MGMQTTKLSEQREYVKALYYGRGGTGKTTALASMANQGRVLYIDAEAGLKRRALVEMGIEVDNIDRLVFDGSLSFEEIENALWEVKSDLADDAGSWYGVAFDSGTEIGQAILDSIVKARVEKAEGIMKQRGKGTVATAMADRFFTDRDDYKENVARLRLLYRMARDLPCHFGSAFLERRDQDEKTRRLWIGPQTSPSLQGDMIGWHDLVGHTEYDDTTDLFTAWYRPQGVAEGKDRYGVLPVRLVDPTMERVIAYIEGELAPESDPRQRVLEQDRESEPTPSDDGEEQEQSALARARATKQTPKASGRSARAEAG